MIKLNALARYGTLITCMMLAGIGALTWIIKYPEIITTQATLTGVHTPKPIVPHVNGRIIRLFKSNKDSVSTGDIIGCMETIADWQEVLKLSKSIDELCNRLAKDDETDIRVMMQELYTNLGELQPAYQAFKQSYISYAVLSLNGYSQKKKAFLQVDNAIIDQTESAIIDQENLYRKDLSINENNLAKNKKLLEHDVISQEEYDRLISENIGKKMGLPQMQSGILGIATQKNGIRKEILEINNQLATQKMLFHEAAFNFKNTVDDWKSKYLITASVSGRLSFTQFIQENQQLEAGKIIAYVNPPNSSYYLQTTIPQQNFGKVKKGQKVLLKFPAFQWQEYGAVYGQVDYVSPVANDSGYVASIILPAGLITNYKKEINFHEGLKADAEIITKDMRLAQRFYYDIIKNIKH